MTGNARATMKGGGFAAALRLPGQSACLLVGLGHGGIHWIAATLYLIIPFIARDLGLDYTEAGLIMTTFHVASALANFPSGSVVDISGRRVVFQVAALALGAAGLFIVGLAPGLPTLYLGVAVIGATNMLWHPAAIAYLSARFPANRGYALSIHALGANLGDALGPLCVGALLGVLAWPATAMLDTLPALAVAAAILLALTRGDAAIAAGGGHRHLGAYLKGVGALIRDRAVLGLSLAAGFRTMAQGGLLLFLPLYLADVMGLAPLWMGVAMMLLQVGGLIAAPVAGILSDRVGRRPIVFAGLGVTTAILIGLTFVGDAVVYVAGISVMGFFLYAVRPVIHGWMMDLVPVNMGGSATSLMFGVQSALSALAPVIGGALADAYGLFSVFYFLAAVMLIANLLTLAVPRRG